MMYCSNCGKKVDENAVICVNCGCKLKNGNGNGKGIASMVLGIVGLFFALCVFTSIPDLGEELDFVTSFSYQFGYAIGFVLIQSALAIPGLCLALVERRKKKTGFNTAGFWLTLLTLVCVVIQFIIVITY